MYIMIASRGHVNRVRSAAPASENTAKKAATTKSAGSAEGSRKRQPKDAQAPKPHPKRKSRRAAEPKCPLAEFIGGVE